MKRLLVPFCLTLIIFIGSAGVSKGAEPIKGYCLSGTKHSHSPIADKCSASYEKGDYETALREFQPLAEQGNIFAQFNLGQMYKRGQGVPKDYKTAVKWYRLAAEQGLADAQTNLGFMYSKGRGVTQNKKTAVKWYRLAAKQGHAKSQYNLGVMYLKGQGVTQNKKTAVKWFRLAAEQRYADAQYNLGAMYYAGDGVKKDNIYAHMWWNILASSGDKEAVTRKNSIEKEMTFDQYEKAHNLAQECIRKKYKGC